MLVAKLKRRLIWRGADARLSMDPNDVDGFSLVRVRLRPCCRLRAHSHFTSPAAEGVRSRHGEADAADTKAVDQDKVSNWRRRTISMWTSDAMRISNAFSCSRALIRWRRLLSVCLVPKSYTFALAFGKADSGKTNSNRSFARIEAPKSREIYSRPKCLFLLPSARRTLEMFLIVAVTDLK
jgi:hypothetical protein